MERTQVLDLMGSLKLYGMRNAYDEVMATGIKRQHEPPRIGVPHRIDAEEVFYLTFVPLCCREHERHRGIDSVVERDRRPDA